jgi:hypothetical protein
MLSWIKANRYERRMQETLNLIFRNHPNLLEFLFDKESPQLRHEPGYLLSEASVFSSGEKILVRVGLDLWSGTVGVSLWDIVERLDVCNYQNVLAGLRHLRRIDDESTGIIWRTK